MSNASSTNNATSIITASRYTSTLLIPESVVWLPYAGLVFTVIIWLGYDFYRFHQKNKQKYQRMEEHMTIIRTVPTRQRISMVSGIGFRFRRGKPVLGEVWNTSPSSSDVSSCYSPLPRGPLAYSREVTPSDEGGGGYSEGETITGCNSDSYVDLVSEEEGEDGDEDGEGDGDGERKGWEIGGEPIAGQIPSSTKAEKAADRSNESFGFDLVGRHPSQIFSTNDSTNGISSPPPGAPPPSRPEEKHHHHVPTNTGENHTRTTSTTAGAGGGVDDGGGGGGGSQVMIFNAEQSKDRIPVMRTPLYQDASTQTNFDEFHVVDMRGGHHSARHLHLPTSPRYVNVSPRHHRYSIAGDLGGLHGLQHRHPGSASPSQPDSPVVIDFSPRSPRLSRDRTISDTGSEMSLPKHTPRTDKRVPGLRLDMLAGTYSPTTEIVATKHGFVVEGVEVPHFPGASPRPIPTVGSDIFKQPETHTKTQPFIKPLTPSPAVTARIASPHPASPRYTSPRHFDSSRSQLQSIHTQQSVTQEKAPQSPTPQIQHPQQQPSPQPQASSQAQKHHHQRSRKSSDNLSVTPRRSSSKKSSSQTKSIRAASSSPRMMKDGEKGDESAFNYNAEGIGTDSPQSAPIPSHLFHQDEEGFFSSVHSASARSRGLAQHDSDSSRKGILFFSRLSGAGRHPHHDASGGGQRRKNSGGTYKTGGFES